VNQSQIYSLAKDAGLPDGKAKIAAAIAMAESGGNQSVITDDSDDYSFGLWQINMKGSMGPSRRAIYGLKSDNDLLDPKTNARVMSSISHQGQNFSAWTTYTSGKYKEWLSNTVAAVDIPVPIPGTALTGFLPDSVPGVSTSINVLDAVTKIGGAVTNTAKWVSNPTNWVRVAYVIGGGILVYAAVETLILPYTSKAVGKVMGVVGPGGKVAKASNAIKKAGASS
jgi:hypothetical protein